MPNPTPDDFAATREDYLAALFDRYPEHEAADVWGPAHVPPRYVLVQRNDRDLDVYQTAADDIETLLKYQENDDGSWYPIGIWDLDTGEAFSVDVKVTLGVKSPVEDLLLPEPDPEVFAVEITLGNEAMKELQDIPGALHRVAQRVAEGNVNGVIRDDNGNTVGSFSLTPSR